MEPRDPSDLLFGIRPARSADATAIARVHVEAWRSAYAGIIPARTLTDMRASRIAPHYEASIRHGHAVLVAQPEGADEPVGFVTAGRARGNALADGEVETLYVLDDWRERGIGRHLIKGAASLLARPPLRCRSVFLWVLSDNPSRWFYERLGGKAVMRSMTRVGGSPVQQTAIVWDPISRLHG